MTRFQVFSEMVEKNGKTVRENNMAVAHKIPVGALVEIIPWDSECGYKGVRLYVIKHTRDCDGTPLYSLGVRDQTWTHGLSEESLTVI